MHGPFIIAVVIDDALLMKFVMKAVIKLLHLIFIKEMHELNTCALSDQHIQYVSILAGIKDYI